MADESKSYQITTIFGRESMAKAISGDLPLPKVAAIAFGDGGHDPAQPKNGKPIPFDQEGLISPRAIIPIADHSYPTPGVVRFTINLTPSSIPGGGFSEAALVDENGKAIAIQTFGLMSISGNSTMTYDWEEVY
ncbi:hypothetical protein P4V33_09170 [Brevibacillus borstelensis]|uniref:hypothetical protein n=1 Tax=Brevibacillus borstelensis TaxID=45462 RepID=UPI002E1A21F7|nr:hypothetical protein [Brevibacillus borstelensis]